MPAALLAICCWGGRWSRICALAAPIAPGLLSSAHTDRPVRRPALLSKADLQQRIQQAKTELQARIDALQAASREEMDRLRAVNSSATVAAAAEVEAHTARRLAASQRRCDQELRQAEHEVQQTRKALHDIRTQCAQSAGKRQRGRRGPQQRQQQQQRRQGAAAAASANRSRARARRRLTHRERLIACYTRYNKAKLERVDATLAKYKGREARLFLLLTQKSVHVNCGSPLIHCPFRLHPDGSGGCCVASATTQFRIWIV